MKTRSDVLRAALAFAAVVLSSGVARACPMCFNGGGSNNQAFVWGSLLLMFVPTAAIGTLVYLAYKRMKAIDASFVPPPAPAQADPSAERVSGERPALRVVPPT